MQTSARRDQTDSYATRTAKHFRVNANSFNRATWTTSPEQTAKRGLNTRRVNGYIIISISCSNTLVRGKGYKPARDWLSTLRDSDAILFAFRQDCHGKINTCFIIIDNLGVLMIQIENDSFLERWQRFEFWIWFCERVIWGKMEDGKLGMNY